MQNLPVFTTMSTALFLMMGALCSAPAYAETLSNRHQLSGCGSGSARIPVVLPHVTVRTQPRGLPVETTPDYATGLVEASKRVRSKGEVVVGRVPLFRLPDLC